MCNSLNGAPIMAYRLVCRVIYWSTGQTPDRLLN